MRTETIAKRAFIFLVLSTALGCKTKKPEQAPPPEAAPEAVAIEDAGRDTGSAAADEDAGTVMLAALRSPTPIYSRPELPPRDPGRIADERKQAVQLGSLRRGQTVAVKGSTGKTPGCGEGWFELATGGWVCGKHATLDLAHKELEGAPHPPYTDQPLPYDYGLNLTNGTPMYRRPPLKRERAIYEKGLLVAGKSAEERAAAAKEAAAEKGETPWYLRDDRERSSVTFENLKGESALVELRMVRGFYVALDQKVQAFAGKFWRTTRGSYVPPDHILVHQSKTEFEGVWVGRSDEPRKLPLGFLLRGSQQYRFHDPAAPPARGDAVERFSIVPLTGKHVVVESRAYDETTQGWWMRATDGVIVRPGSPPADLGPGEKWIEVNLAAQTLVAFEGDKPVFATLVSSGRHDDNDKAKDHRTPAGSFRIREKHISTTMDDDTATDGPYSIEDVPWVMYFEKSYALHGAFWHSSFGHERSHGCVNLTPHDARELFQWVAPTLPAGWHAVRATADNPGTRVVVHE